MHGASHPYANTFANIDGLLREWGFSLFDVDLWRYSRRSLPDKFYYQLAGQTVTGQVQWGEAVYFRDLARPDYEQMHGFAAGTGEEDQAGVPVRAVRSAGLFRANPGSAPAADGGPFLLNSAG